MHPKVQTEWLLMKTYVRNCTCRQTVGGELVTQPWASRWATKFSSSGYEVTQYMRLLYATEDSSTGP